MDEKKDDHSGKFISFGTVVAGLSAILLVVFGWLFNLLVNSISTIGDRQIEATKQVVTNEIMIDTNTRRLTKLEDEQLHTNRIRAERVQENR